MRKVCLTLPTNRACAATIAAVNEEAAYAARHFGAEVHLLILDSCDDAVRAEHARAVRDLPAAPHVVVHHLDEEHQRGFLRRVVDRAGLDKPDPVLDLMLPDRLSYGACTNRAFLIAAALGCESVHRRDSDSRYQVVDGVTLFPVRHELASLGKRAADAAGAVDETALDPRYAHRPVTMVGASFVGEMSVDVSEMERLDRRVYDTVVSLWAPAAWTEERKRSLVEESFRGAGPRPYFTRDHATLTVVDPMRVDMCNIAFHGVHEQVPLPPATDTIGSDYFLIHLVHDTALPGVLHNRDIVNFHTAERRTGPGFLAYHLRFAKFLLSMLYFNAVYDAMARAGETLLDDRQRVRVPALAALVRDTAGLDRTENVQRLDTLDRCYRQLGGRYAEFADLLADRRDCLLHEARQDIEDFAVLMEGWEPLIRAARDTSPYPPATVRLKDR